MNTSVNQSQNTTQYSFGENSLNGAGKKVEAGNFVVKPPEKFYRFSVYDELKLDRDTFSEFLQKTDPQTYKKRKKIRKTKKFLYDIATIGFISLTAVLCYKNQAKIKGFLLNTFEKTKKLFKK